MSPVQHQKMDSFQAGFRGHTIEIDLTPLFPVFSDKRINLGEIGYSQVKALKTKRNNHFRNSKIGIRVQPSKGLGSMRQMFAHLSASSVGMAAGHRDGLGIFGSL